MTPVPRREEMSLPVVGHDTSWWAAEYILYKVEIDG